MTPRGGQKGSPSINFQGCHFHITSPALCGTNILHSSLWHQFHLFVFLHVLCAVFVPVLCVVCLPVLCILFILCYVQFLACVMCSSRATARLVAAGGRFAPAGLASLASLATKLGVVHVLGKETK